MSNPQPAVSIIIPIFNLAPCLSRCLESALGQTLTELEVIAVDDGSSDASPALLDAYARRYPRRLQAIHQPNRGVSAARNAALDAARGEYVLFLDGDDYLERSGAEALLAQARAARADICRGIEARITLAGRRDLNTITHQLIRRYRSRLFFFGHWWVALYRRALLEDLQLRFDETLALAEDLLFQHQALLNCRVLALCDAEVYNYCHRAGSEDYGLSLLPPRKVENMFSSFSRIAASLQRHHRQLDVPGMGYVYEQMIGRLRGSGAQRCGPQHQDLARRCLALAEELQRSCPPGCAEAIRHWQNVRYVPGSSAASQAGSPRPAGN